MKPLLILLLLAMTGCHLRHSPLRSEYHLHQSDDFIISNLYVHPTELKQQGGELKLQYSLVLKNLKMAEREVNLKEASIKIGLRSIPISCVRYKSEEVAFSVAPEETISIKCHIEINKSEGMFQVKDYKAVIEIPLEKEKAYFTYLFRAEDFQ